MITQIPQKARLAELDMIKGLAIILVMLRRISELSGFTYAISPIFGTLTECLMVLFFIASGYVYKPKQSVLASLKHKVKTLLVPLFWALVLITALYFTSWVLKDGASLSWFFKESLDNWVGFANFNLIEQNVTPNELNYGVVAFWFIYELFAAFCLFVPLFALVSSKSLSAKLALFCVLLGLCVLCVIYDPQGTIKRTYGSPVPYAFVIINIFGFSALLMLGAILKELSAFDLSTQKRGFRLFFALLSFVILALILSDYSPSGYAFQYGRWGQYGAISVIITTLGGLALSYFLLFCAYYLKNLEFAKNFFLFFGKNTLDFFLWHIFVAETICYIGGFWHPVYHETYDVNNFSYLAWVLTVLLSISLCACYVWLKNRKKSAKIC